MLVYPRFNKSFLFSNSYRFYFARNDKKNLNLFVVFFHCRKFSLTKSNLLFILFIYFILFYFILFYFILFLRTRPGSFTTSGKPFIVTRIFIPRKRRNEASFPWKVINRNAVGNDGNDLQDIQFFISSIRNIDLM